MIEMHLIGESGDLAVELSNSNPELPVVITTQEEIVRARRLLNELESALLKRRLSGSDKG